MSDQPGLQALARVVGRHYDDRRVHDICAGLQRRPTAPMPATFNLVYVDRREHLGGSITRRALSGDVIARTGNTLTLLGSTLFLNTANTFLLLQHVAARSGAAGSRDHRDRGRQFDADRAQLRTPSPSASTSSARGIYSRRRTASPVILDSTGTSSTNTGSVRLQSTEFWGSLVSSSGRQPGHEFASHQRLAGQRL